MNSLVLGGLLAALIVVPLVLIAIFYVIGKLFRAPRRFASILFVILFVAVLGAAAYGYLRAGQASTATVTSMSERVVVDDALRSRHEFQAGVQIPDLGARTVSVPARIYDQLAVGETVDVRAGSVLGLKLARAQDERITDLIGLGSLVCAVLVVLFAACAAASRTARAPAILLMLGALAGIGVQPAIEATPLLGGTTATATATVTGVATVGSESLTGMPAGFLRGPFSIDHRWMWANDKDLQFVAVTFTPDGGTAPVTAVDVIAKSSTPAAGSALQIQYETSHPRRITSDVSQATQCAWIMAGVLALIELMLLLIGIVIWRLRARRRRREADQRVDLDRDVNQAIEVNTRRDGQQWPDDTHTYPPYTGPEIDDETRPLRPVGPGMADPRAYQRPSAYQPPASYPPPAVYPPPAEEDPPPPPPSRPRPGPAHPRSRRQSF